MHHFNSEGAGVTRVYLARRSYAADNNAVLSDVVYSSRFHTYDNKVTVTTTITNTITVQH